MSQPAIQADGLTKYYGAVVGIEELSFEVARGRDLRVPRRQRRGQDDDDPAAARPAAAVAGRGATVLGLDCQRDSLEARRRIGYLPGDLPDLPGSLGAPATSTISPRLDGRPVAARYLDDLLRASTSATSISTRRLRDQSHGMKQKIGIIQALMGARAGRSSSTSRPPASTR